MAASRSNSVSRPPVSRRSSTNPPAVSRNASVGSRIVPPTPGVHSPGLLSPGLQSPGFLSPGHGFDFGFNEIDVSRGGNCFQSFSVPHLPSQDDRFSVASPHLRHSRFLSASHSMASAKTYKPRPYFKSRRIRKGTIDRPELRERDPRAVWITLIPCIGFAIGAIMIAFFSYRGYTSISNYEYCTVFVDDFSNGFNTSIWTKEVETGGFGGGSFEMTTGGDENVFVRDNQLVIKPTIWDKTYIDNTRLVNLTADGTCTSTSPDNCVLSANLTAGEIVQPVKSGRISTKKFHVIRYGRVDMTVKVARGDWLLSQLMMWPAENYYGAWPASGEIDIGMIRGNNYSYGKGEGNQLLQSSLHWGPDPTTDRWQTTNAVRNALVGQTWGDEFHRFGVEWTKNYLFTWVDSRLAQVEYVKFNQDFFDLGGYGPTYKNGSKIVNPWVTKGATHATPFDRPFYLVIGLTVGGTSGWFADGVQDKPWADASLKPRKDFWDGRDQWAPTWSKPGYGEMIVEKVAMYQQCDNGATDLSAFD